MTPSDSTRLPVLFASSTRLLDGEVAWGTGGGRGTGLAAALALAEHGAAVAVSSRTGREIEEVASEVKRRGGRAFAVPVDVSEHPGVERGAREIENGLGPVTILVNNAAILTPLGKAWMTDPAAWGLRRERGWSSTWARYPSVTPRSGRNRFSGTLRRLSVRSTTPPRTPPGSRRPRTPLVPPWTGRSRTRPGGRGLGPRSA